MPREDFAKAIFAGRLKELRKKEGLTQEMLGAALGVDRSTYTYYETGKSSPDLRMVCRLAGIFRVTPNDLLGEAAKISTEFHDNPLRMDDEQFITKFSLLTGEEQLLIMRYRQLSDEERKDVQQDIKERLRY